jgi:hypothetical protein
VPGGFGHLVPRGGICFRTAAWNSVSFERAGYFTPPILSGCVSPYVVAPTADSSVETRAAYSAAALLRRAGPLHLGQGVACLARGVRPNRMNRVRAVRVTGRFPDVVNTVTGHHHFASNPTDHFARFSGEFESALPPRTCRNGRGACRRCVAGQIHYLQQLEPCNRLIPQG